MNLLVSLFNHLLSEYLQFYNTAIFMNFNFYWNIIDFQIYGPRVLTFWEKHPRGTSLFQILSLLNIQKIPS